MTPTVLSSSRFWSPGWAIAVCPSSSKFLHGLFVITFGRRGCSLPEQAANYLGTQLKRAKKAWTFYPDSFSTFGKFLENIAYISRDVNPPNCPRLRPIEDFWGWLKSCVYDGGLEAVPERALKQRILAKLKEFKVLTVKSCLVTCFVTTRSKV
jgi:hypothetical protein